MKINEPQQRLLSLYGNVDNSFNELISKYIKGKNILDLGCGYGALVNYLNKSGYNILGIDHDKDSINKGKKIFGNINIKIGTIDGLSLQTKFDTIILKDCIHHIYGESTDPIEAFSKIHNLLTPKGRIIIFDPNINLIIKIARFLIKHKDPECSFKNAIKLLEQTNFKILETEYYDTFGIALSGGYVGPKFIPNNKTKSGTGILHNRDLQHS
mgnify:FL=1